MRTEYQDRVRESGRKDVLVTGGTGYLGTRLIRTLLDRGHTVRALVRSGSAGRIPDGAVAIPGDALSADSVRMAMREGDTVVHLVGTPHPGPGKTAEFQRVDLASIRATVSAASRVRPAHIVYLSVAQPAPILKDYQAVRAEGERLIGEGGFAATFMRPWYVLGPGHRWPLVLLPMYAVASLVPALREGARRTGLVTISQMTGALVHAVENPPAAGSQRIATVADIRGGLTKR